MPEHFVIRYMQKKHQLMFATAKLSQINKNMRYAMVKVDVIAFQPTKFLASAKDEIVSFFDHITAVNMHC